MFSKDSILVSHSILETESEGIFKITSILNGESIFKEKGVVLSSDKYSIETETSNKDFKVNDDMIFKIQINNRLSVIKPLFKANALLKLCAICSQNIVRNKFVFFILKQALILKIFLRILLYFGTLNSFFVNLTNRLNLHIFSLQTN